MQYPDVYFGITGKYGAFLKLSIFLIFAYIFF